MHHLVSTDNGVNWTGIATVYTAYAEIFVDDCHHSMPGWFLFQRENIPPQQCGKLPDCLLSARWAQVNRFVLIDDRFGVGAATRITTLRTLCLGQ